MTCYRDNGNNTSTGACLFDFDCADGETCVGSTCKPTNTQKPLFNREDNVFNDK